MKRLPKISILIPTYNSQRFVGRAISSAISQEYANLEIVITDNNSTDCTMQICKQFQQIDSRITIYRNDENIGMVKNWNRGLRKLTGDYFVLLCSDDWLETTFLRQSVKGIDKREITFSNAFVISNNCTEIYSNPFNAKQKVGLVGVLRKLHGIPLSSVLFPLVRGELFDEDLPFNCDLEYIIRLMINYGFILSYLGAPLVNVEIHQSNETLKYNIKNENIKLLHKLLGHKNISLVARVATIMKLFRLKYA